MVEILDQELRKELEAILDRLPGTGETQYPGMGYEDGIREVLMYLLGEIEEGEEFEYAHD